jgi:hypothetical protein
MAIVVLENYQNYQRGSCRGLTRATHILCIEHPRLKRLIRESNPGPHIVCLSSLYHIQREERLREREESEVAIITVLAGGRDEQRQQKVCSSLLLLIPCYMTV